MTAQARTAASNDGSNNGPIRPAIFFPDGCHSIHPLTCSWQPPSEVERFGPHFTGEGTKPQMAQGLRTNGVVSSSELRYISREASGGFSDLRLVGLPPFSESSSGQQALLLYLYLLVPNLGDALFKNACITCVKMPPLPAQPCPSYQLHPQKENCFDVGVRREAQSTLLRCAQLKVSESGVQPRFPISHALPCLACLPNSPQSCVSCTHNVWA